ncbi:hypothetical protein [Crateriforma conspicua]|uniref:hypothetical protein n=1 Tax=Crateriforma conspicua TaxID=2527996 RepID=UPI00118CCC29|nr:hypothetical protein [Crateriforma conspicua]QDV66255.1 hypothetical protein Mal65_54310 [Crateriforma conspicua]
MGLLQRGADWLSRTMTADSSSDTTRQFFYRYGTRRFPIHPTIGQTDYEAEDSDGQITTMQTRDFIVPVSELVDESGEPFTPADDHQIEEVVGDQTYLYQLRSPDGRRAWRYSDHHRYRIRIHTVQVAHV